MSKIKSNISIDVELDVNRVPEKIHWTAKDGGIENEAAGAFMVSVWDEKQKECLRLDLWTKEMSIDDMKRFFHQTILSMADTLERATNEERAAMKMRQYAHQFGLDVEIIEEIKKSGDKK